MTIGNRQTWKRWLTLSLRFVKAGKVSIRKFTREMCPPMTARWMRANEFESRTLAYCPFSPRMRTTVSWSPLMTPSCSSRIISRLWGMFFNKRRASSPKEVRPNNSCPKPSMRSSVNWATLPKWRALLIFSRMAGWIRRRLLLSLHRKKMS